MKTTAALFILSLALLFPAFSFADVPGGGVSVHTAFKITNTKSFPDYTFYYSRWSDSTEIKQGKKYSFSHRGNPNIAWGIYIYAVNKSSKKETVAFDVGSNETMSTITIREIKNDTIYFDKSESAESGTGDGAFLPSDDNAPLGNGVVASGVSAVNYLLIGISAGALLIFGLLTFFRTKRA